MKKLILNNNTRFYLDEFEVNNTSHIDDLFYLIKNKQHHISYIIPPTKKQHQEFCINHPYRFCFLLYEDKKLHGSIYITYENSIGINFLDLKNKNNIAIIKYILLNIEPMPPKASLVQSNFYCNVAPNNKELIELVKKLGAEISQVSYKFNKLEH